jgi:hypothetical protein
MPVIHGILPPIPEDLAKDIVFQDEFFNGIS